MWLFMVEKELIRRLKKIHPLFKPLMEMAVDSYDGGRNEKYYLEFDDGIHYSLGTVNIQSKHDEYEKESVTKFTYVTLELFNMRTGRVTQVALSYAYQFSINLNGGISKRIPTDCNDDNNIKVNHRNLTEDDINLLESKNQSNHHVCFYEKAESSEDEYGTNGEFDFIRRTLLLPFYFSVFMAFTIFISDTFGTIISVLESPLHLGQGIIPATLNFLSIPITFYFAYRLTKMSKPIVNKLLEYFSTFIDKLTDVILKLGAKVFSHFESTREFSSVLKDELEHGVNTRSQYMINSDIAINQPTIRKELNTIILLNNEPTTPYRLHEFLDMTKTSNTGRYNKLIFNFGDKGHVIKRITPSDVDALSDTDYETKAIVDSCIAEPLTPQEVKHIMSTIENVKKVKKEEKEQAKSQHYYNKYKPQAQSREGEPSVFEQTLSELEKDIRDDMEKHKDVMEKHKS